MNDNVRIFLAVVIIVGSIVFEIWVNFFAPCRTIGWMKVGQLPGRCITVVK